MKFTTIIAAFLAPVLVMAATTEEETIEIMASKKGQLYVKLNKATKLTDKDLFGKSDPFIEMWIEKAYKQRSKDTKGLNPTFNETFCFYVRPGQNKLNIRAVDKDTFINDKIGETSISLSNVISTGSEGPQDYKLPKWLGFSDNGSVNMQMQFVEDNS
ncbi:hypothetical protein EMPS_02454 [Entomortierella parvispora]|uniref:C2 domain-containing protein n=1 Tax=Entomortierella parvispora TaxID=205924 RepID=A0A9P3LTY3_9FUNG|nr:hypothetical protein EMPS_02454 [Entomortierella parvispora]